jgi:hypothetical protein
LSLFFSIQAQVASKPVAADDTDLKSVELKWVNAHYSGDDKTLSLIEADDFKAIANNEKPETKAEQIAAVQVRGPVGFHRAMLKKRSGTMAICDAESHLEYMLR